ncbi:hypothetical protein LCGC14_1755620, partial [marine sediment metagenome]
MAYGEPFKPVNVRAKTVYVDDRFEARRRARLPNYTAANLPAVQNLPFDVVGIIDEDTLGFRNAANAAWLRLGGAPVGADYVVGTANAVLTNELVLGADVIMSDILANIPAAALAGSLYFATDTRALYR